jgi:hypothetical protein
LHEVRRDLVLATVLCGGFALYCFWPQRDSLIGWGSDPWFNLWTFEIAWHRIARDGPLWFIHRAAWRAPLFGGAELGLAYSENQAWPALFLFPLREWSGNGAWTMQVGAVAMALLAFFCTTAWLRRLGIGGIAPWGGVLFAASGWIQSQRGHYQNLCIFVIPLTLWAFATLRARPAAWRALLAGASLGWIAGWNVYFLFFSTVALTWLMARSLRRGELSWLHSLAFVAAAAVLVAPFAVRYAELGRMLGGYRAFISYGTTFRDLLARTHAPRLLPPHFEAAGEAGGAGVVWIALCVLALRLPRARPWLVASAIAYWVALGSSLGAWQLLSGLPWVSGMRAIGRAECLVILFSIPAILLCLESMPRKVAGSLLLLAILELVPVGRPERVPVDPGWFGLTPLTVAMAERGPTLIVPRVDHELMAALVSTEATYFGGWSGRDPPGEELLSRFTPRPDAAQDAIAATGARRVLARTPEFAQAIARIPGAMLVGKFDGGSLFDVPAAPPPLSILRDASAEERDAPWPTLELRAVRTGVLSIRELDSCRLREQLRLGPLVFEHELRLQGNELKTLAPQTGDVILHHQSRRAIFHLPLLRASSHMQVVCDAAASGGRD